MRWFVLLGILCGRIYAATPVCPAGVPVGEMQLHVSRPGLAENIAIREVARLLPGDRIVYEPSQPDGGPRKGQAAMILVPSRPDGKDDVALLAPKPASGRSEWVVNIRAKTAVFIYGPNGLNARKVRRYLTKDSTLIEQLADYAQNTAQTEILLQALADPYHSGATENLSAALSGFASQYGLSNRINRAAPAEQQTLALFRSLNPALATYDPISPQGTQRVSQTAGLATVVAGMFLGNPVGLAAGGAALGVNFKSMLFPDTEFRSSFAQPGSKTISLCGKREPSRGRTHMAYVWAVRVPDADAPTIEVAALSNTLAGVKNKVMFKTADPDLKSLERVRGWEFTAAGQRFAVPARKTEARTLEFDLAAVPPGVYSLRGNWDYTPFDVAGTVTVHAAPDLSKARLTADTHDLLVEHSGRRAVTLEGADFQFAEKLTLLRKDDRFGSPIPVSFRLPIGWREGIQQKLDVEIDTGGLARGEFELRLEQGEGRWQTAILEVLAPAPRITNLPVRIHLGETAQPVRLEGEGVERIGSLHSEGVDFRLGRGDSRTRRAEATVRGELRAGQVLELLVHAESYSNPIRIPGGIRVAPPRPAIGSTKVLSPSGLGIVLREGELPAGVQTGAVVDIKNAAERMTVEIGCRGSRHLRAAVGEQRDGLKVQSLGADRVYVAFDAAAWPAGCVLEAVIDAGDQGSSAPSPIGRTIRFPRVEKFELTDQDAGDGSYFGLLTGRDLELIERVGWTGAEGLPVTELPSTAGASLQTLRMRLPWPSPTPRAPLFFWLRGDSQGRATTIR